MESNLEKIGKIDPGIRHPPTGGGGGRGRGRGRGRGGAGWQRLIGSQC